MSHSRSFKRFLVKASPRREGSDWQKNVESLERDSLPSLEAYKGLCALLKSQKSEKAGRKGE